MKNILILSIAIVITGCLSSCKKDEATENTPITYANFSQLKTGNYWIYERFTVDSAGAAVATGILDSCYIETDTLINNHTYYKLISPNPYGILPEISLPQGFLPLGLAISNLEIFIY